MSEQRVLTCDHCGISKLVEETTLWTAMVIAGVRSPDPMRAHLCTMCVPALAEFLPKIAREQFAALAVHEVTIPIRADERSVRQEGPVDSRGQVNRIYTHARLRPSRALKVNKIVIDGNPNDWLVGDVVVGGRSQFAQTGDVPGCVFAEGVEGADLDFEVCGTQIDIHAAYVGTNPEGAIFAVKLIGEMQGFPPEAIAAPRALDATSPAGHSA